MRERTKAGFVRKTIGPATVAVEPKQIGTEDGKLGVSATYRNRNAINGLPTTVRVGLAWVSFTCLLNDDIGERKQRVW
jgi:hypothetical protein